MAKKISNEYKLECIKMILEHGYTHQETADEMKVGLSSLQRWVKQYKNENLGITPKQSALTGLHKRIQQLEKELKQEKIDKEILKKASAFFAAEMKTK